MTIVRRLLLVVCPVLLLAAFAPTVGAFMRAPEPSPVPRRWQLDVTFGDLRVVRAGGTQYYVLTYRVTNYGQSEQLFAPSFELVGDDGVVHRSGRSVPAAVTEELIRAKNNPMLEDQIGIIGQLGQGAENAKEGLVAWPVVNAKPGTISIYAAGFSGETALVDAPDAPAPASTKDQPKFTLRKTRVLTFQDVGDLSQRSDDPLPQVDARWVMR